MHVFQVKKRDFVKKKKKIFFFFFFFKKNIFFLFQSDKTQELNQWDVTLEEKKSTFFPSCVKLSGNKEKSRE